MSVETPQKGPQTPANPPDDGHRAPILAIVGHANTGKSTLIATLTETSEIQISDVPGTTTQARSFEVSVDGRVLFSLVDTPGFEDAAGAFGHIERFSKGPDDRSQAVQSFLQAWAGSAEFQAEQRLLKAVMDADALLYVVDGSYPWRATYENELEILRWTGKPRMALINRTADSDFAEAWERPLDQFFSLTRQVSARDASLEDRLGLLRALGGLRHEWEAPMSTVTHALEAQRDQRRYEAARVIANALDHALRYTRRERVIQPENLQAESSRIEQAFHDELRKLEANQRRALAQSYGFKKLESQPVGELAPPKLNEDLFAESSWEQGLSTRQLVAAGTAAGALTGLGLDAMVGGLSGGIGALIGGAIGAAGAAYVRRDALMKAAVEESIVGGASVPDWMRQRAQTEATVVVGPHKGRNFPWVWLSRALSYWHAVEARTHAQRDTMRVSGVLASSKLPEAHRSALAKALADKRARVETLQQALLSCFADPQVQRLLDEASAEAEEAALGAAKG